MLSRKAADIGAFCCAPGITDRLPGLRFHTLGIAAVVLLVHPDNPVDNISIGQAREIFMGETIRWSEREAIKRLKAHSLTHQLLTFSKGGEPVKRLVNIMDIINEAVSLSLRGSNVQCESSCTDDLWHIEVDEGQMNQVFSNILINADHAIPDGGLISVNCENVSIEGGEDSILNKGDYVEISLKDQGIGISEEDISRIFDPYFTTKEKGSGPGLSTAYSIINRHGGHIDVESSAGHGTVFTIYLPASREKAIDRKLSEAELIT
jgi:signal transduction histidine kinase